MIVGLQKEQLNTMITTDQFLLMASAFKRGRGEEAHRWNPDKGWGGGMKCIFLCCLLIANNLPNGGMVVCWEEMYLVTGLGQG